MARRKATPIVIDESPADADDLLDEAAVLMRAELAALAAKQRRAGRLADKDFRRFMALTDRLGDMSRASVDSWRSEMRQARRMTEAQLEALEEGMESAKREAGDAS